MVRRQVSGQHGFATAINPMAYSGKMTRSIISAACLG